MGPESVTDKSTSDRSTSDVGPTRWQRFRWVVNQRKNGIFGVVFAVELFVLFGPTFPFSGPGPGS
jgi:hypothetical protein